MTSLDRRTAAPDLPPGAAALTGIATACGKVILSGEHAVVYGKHALAVAVPRAARAHMTERVDGIQTVRIPAWGVSEPLRLSECPQLMKAFLQAGSEALRVGTRGWDLHVDMDVPRGSGLGGSAALAVAFVRTLARTFGLEVTDEQVNAAAFACEKVAHGTPSGVDNAVATYGRALLFRKAPPLMQTLPAPKNPMRMVVGLSGEPGMTLEMVKQVRALRDAQMQRVDALMDAIDACACAASDAFAAGDAQTLGHIMNENQTHLASLGVSSATLDHLIAIARAHGARGAKLTGGGGGGAMIALADDGGGRIARAFERAGFSCRLFDL